VKRSFDLRVHNCARSSALMGRCVRQVRLLRPKRHLMVSFNFKNLKFAVLLAYLPSCLGHETTMWPLRSSSQVATCYYQSNHSKIEAVSLSALPNDTASELAGLSSITLSRFNAERQAGKLWIPTFKVFWSDSTRALNPVIPNMWTL